jgi:hypothetical protein
MKNTFFSRHDALLSSGKMKPSDCQAPFFALLIASVVLGAIPAQAGLRFDQLELKETAAPGADVHTAIFHFTAEGTKPTEIKKIETNCGCLGGHSEKLAYQPGEKGTIQAKFELGTFEGTVSKSLVLHTDDAASPTQPLIVTMTIPKVFSIEPEMAKWDIGEAPTPKVLTFRNLIDIPVQVKNLTTTRDNMKAEFKEITPGREYQITLTPETTAEPMLGALRIETDCPYPRFQKRLVFFNVTRPTPNPTLPE